MIGRYDKENFSRRNKKRGMILAIFICLGFLYWYYVMIYRQSTELSDGELRSKDKETNTDAALYSLEEQMALLENFEELYGLAFEKNADELEYGTIVIPGLKTTRSLTANESEIGICTSMTPQGLCIAEDYVLISAYCHTNTHNSVIYVIDKNTHRFIKEIVLKDKNHVGGLAYDKVHKMVWVSTDHDGRAAASAFSLKRLEEYDLNQSGKPITYIYDYDLYTLERDSFMTYENGFLYIGHFSSKKRSVVQKFRIEKNGGLKTRWGTGFGIEEMIAVPEEMRIIPKKTQGFAVYQDKVILAQSYGVEKSELLVFHYDDIMYRTEPQYTLNKIVMPQKLEQIYIDGKDLYILFESAAYAYRAQPFPKVDRVLKLDLNKIINENYK